MTRRISHFLVALFLVVFCANAQNQVAVFSLSRAKMADSQEFWGIAKVTVKAVESYDNAQAALVSVTIENITDNSSNACPLLIFKKGYDQKDLGKLKDELGFKIGCKNPSLLPKDSCDQITKNHFISQSQSVVIIPEVNLKIMNGDSVSFNLPIHTTTEIKYKDKNTKIKELKLGELFVLKITISVDLGPDTEYEDLKIRCDDLCDKSKFCKNPKHQPTINEQQQNFIIQQTELDRAIKEVLNNKYQLPASKINEVPKYYDLDQQLKNALTWVNDTSLWSDCGKHLNPLKRCTGCNRSRSNCKSGCKHDKNCKCGIEERCSCGQLLKNCKTRCNGKHYTLEEVRDEINGLARDIDKSGGKIKDKAQRIQRLRCKAKSIIKTSERDIANRLINDL